MHTPDEECTTQRGRLKHFAQICQETGKEQEVQVLYDEGLANHIGPEPCGGLREETNEKSVGDMEARYGVAKAVRPERQRWWGVWKATSRSTPPRVLLGLCAV
jgi:hypothetical protein